MKLKHDKYYTPKELALKLIETTYKVPENYDFGICTWGNGSLGKPVEFVGQYAQEVYFYCNPKYLERIKELMSFENIRAYVNSISAKRISVARLYKYIKDSIKEIE